MEMTYFCFYILELVIELSLQRTWNKDLENKSSQAFKELSRTLEILVRIQNRKSMSFSWARTCVFFSYLQAIHFFFWYILVSVFLYRFMGRQEQFFIRILLWYKNQDSFQAILNLSISAQVCEGGVLPYNQNEYV